MNLFSSSPPAKYSFTDELQSQWFSQGSGKRFTANDSSKNSTPAGELTIIPEWESPANTSSITFNKLEWTDNKKYTFIPIKLTTYKGPKGLSGLDIDIKKSGNNFVGTISFREKDINGGSEGVRGSQTFSITPVVVSAGGKRKTKRRHKKRHNKTIHRRRRV